MSVGRSTSAGRAPLVLFALLAGSTTGCSGGSLAGLELLPSKTDFVDAGTDSVRNHAVDAATTADVQPPSPAAPTGTPYVGRSDNFSPMDAGASASEGGAFGATATDDAAADATSEPVSEEASSPAASCIVNFTVEDAFIDGIVVQNVVVGGDALALGNWDPTLARNMAEASGAVGKWTLSVQTPSGQTVHFKFGMRGSGQVTWETLSQDRTLEVTCPTNEALSYVGQFGVLPDGG